MNGKDKVDALVKARDGLRMAAESIDDLIEIFKPKELQGDTFPDLSMIIWKDVIGDKGPFELAEASSNLNNAVFARLGSYLKAHNGKATISGYFTWIFTDGSGSIGRKVAQKRV